jgi:hypothetical protein
MGRSAGQTGGYDPNPRVAALLDSHEGPIVLSNHGARQGFRDFPGIVAELEHIQDALTILFKLLSDGGISLSLPLHGRVRPLLGAISADGCAGVGVLKTQPSAAAAQARSDGIKAATRHRARHRRRRSELKAMFARNVPVHHAARGRMGYVAACALEHSGFNLTELRSAAQRAQPHHH